ncbi:MAG TPA: alkaline phosphatase D family protein [Methylomirabilota bacterium]|nr:alkaline phosphatase D family protein [Methylomirabilota bacterium]
MTSPARLSLAALLCALSWGFSFASSRATETDPPHLVLEPMIGHVTSTSAIVWAKASGPAAMSVLLGQAADLSDGQEFRDAPLREESGFTGKLLIEKLAPAQRYHYCVLLDGTPMMSPPYPAFHTAPPEGEPGRVRFAFTSCVGDHGYNSAAGFADMTRTNFDLLLLLGDNHYANTNAATVQRRFYHEQRDTPGYRHLCRQIPTYGIWDDHDYGPDNSDRTLPGKEESLRTFREHWPNPGFGEPDNPGVYFKFTRGQVEFFMLDVRYHRDPNKATNAAGKTMLGARQTAWLKRALLESRARLKVIASGSEWHSHGTDDSWTSFKQERDDIFAHIMTNKIEGVLLISGDRHFTAAYQVRGQWIEVTSGPIGSSNAKTKNLPEMFLNFSDSKAKFYCIYDLDTRPETPVVTLEVYRVGEGLAHRRVFTWDEVLGNTKIPPLPALPPTAR